MLPASLAEMTKAPRLNLFTIPVHRAFADSLAAGIVRLHSAERLQLARGMILLPNARAVSAVRDAFIRLAGGALLLPRLVALGEGDLEAAAGAALDRVDEYAMPPVIDPVQRRLLLAGILRRIAPDRATGASEALRLAESLGRSMDALAFEEKSVAELMALKDADIGLAQHWEAGFDLLSKLASEWPAVLAALGLEDRAHVRNLLLNRTAESWQAKGLPVPWVVAAGITTAAPAVARLLGTIARQPGGTVVFPHIDLAMPVAVWDALGDVSGDDHENVAPPQEAHAQFHLKLLLKRIGAGRDDVTIWPEGSPHDGPESREPFIATMLAPAVATDAWPGVPASARALPGVTKAICATPAEEALAIALAMREALEVPGKTAALVTPDRMIASRVTGHLTRWGLVVDDSAGTPLPQTPAGALVIALARAAGSGFAPVDLLALLSHPLVPADGDERREWLDRVRALDLALRGPRPRAGLKGVGDAIAGLDGRSQTGTSLEAWWHSVADVLAPLDEKQSQSLIVWLDRLRECLGILAGAALWSGAAGRALSARFETLIDHAHGYAEAVSSDELANVLHVLLSDVAVRPPQGGHPRLFIWGLIEARLQRADRMILAGLNEGQWPQTPEPDPWLAPGIRRRLGLPGLERQIGLASHDFASALGAGEVILTRSKRDGGAPTVPSRLLLRIDAFAGSLRPGAGQLDLANLAAAIDTADRPQPMSRPEPSPPVSLRKSAISASQLDVLLADPFVWYAQNILGLRRLDALDDDPTPMWRGTLVHALLEDWLKSDNYDPEALIRRAEQRLAEPDISVVLRTIWGPRLLAALRWAGETIVANKAAGRVPLLDGVEERGQVMIGGIRLSGKADRIDRLPDGGLAIVDYKTGGKANKRTLASGFLLQLGLLGAIAEHGGFKNIDGVATTFEYWRLNKAPRGDGFGWVESPFYKRAEDGVQADGFVAMAVQRLSEAAPWLLGDAPFKARLHPEYSIYGDFDQLMRLEEWYGVQDSGELSA